MTGNQSSTNRGQATQEDLTSNDDGIAPSQGDRSNENRKHFLLAKSSISPGPPGSHLSNSRVHSLFTALQEQLGLKPESQKGPVDTIVVDHVERPSPN